MSSPRSTLALIGGFAEPPKSSPHGTLHAAFAACDAIAATGRYAAIHVYHDQQSLRSGVKLPDRPPARAFDKRVLCVTPERYAAIFVANGEQITSTPFVLRPDYDWAPVVCSIGTTHMAQQWASLLVALASDAVRPTDGWIFKSTAARQVFQEAWGAWTERFGFACAPPAVSAVIPNGVDVERHRPSAETRQAMRRALGIGDERLLYLAFSRLSPGTKGDQLALVVRWREVARRVPNATLLLSGAVVDPWFVEELTRTVREAGVAGSVIVQPNPAQQFDDAGHRVMCAADVFVHLSTGVEEASSNVVHEAMAHRLPVIAADWAGMRETVIDGKNGYLVGTRSVPLPPWLRRTVFGADHVAHSVSLGRAVSCDWRAFVDRAARLAERPLRESMGAQARSSAEAGSLPAMARAYVDFFDRAEREASAAWPARAAPLRPLVDLDALLRTQAAGALRPEDRVRAGDASLVALLTTGALAEDARLVDAVLRALAQNGEATLGELARVVLHAAGGNAAGDAQALAHAGLLVVRLLNYGVIEPAGAS
jgi:glycosyltransferase involved in cell wall biosynthesis